MTTAAKTTKGKAGYKRVPTEDVWATDAEFEGRQPNQKYDWVDLGDKAIERPGEWLLVDANGKSAISSNITAERIKTLTGPRYVGWRFRGRIDQMTQDPETGKWTGRVWISAKRVPVTP